MSIERTLIGVSVIASATYGLWLARRPISPLRTIVKTAAVAALAVLAYVAGAPPPLTIGLILSAAGDAFLAGDKGRWLPVGLGAFLFAQVCYIALFVHDGGGRAALIAEPVRTLGVAAAFATGVTMLTWLWKDLGAMRGAVTLYVVAICVMMASSFTLPHRLWPAIAGAVAFTASDSVLAAELFQSLDAAWASYAVWGLYYAAQALIVWAYLR